MEGQSLLPMRAVLEVSARSTESRALSLFFLGFSFPFRPPHKPSFPVVFQCSWFTFNEGMQGLSSISTAYGNIKLVSLAAKDDCVFAVEILTSAVGSKILWWLQPFHYLFLITRLQKLTAGYHHLSCSSLDWTPSQKKTEKQLKQSSPSNSPHQTANNACTVDDISRVYLPYKILLEMGKRGEVKKQGIAWRSDWNARLSS
ncbi:hypothetical protein V6N11_026147 [Hibiscus sabdariffa]|uniref:Uncharacterized protein n=1 Tax=Hibiscus sabdariffa TaxID=183260 RepID=A0ABR2SVM7_9ROSI